METVLTASEVADRLGLSPSQVRRHAKTYEQVFGELGKDSRGHRYYTLRMVETLEVAHSAVVEGRASSVEAALVAERDGEALGVAPGARSGALELMARALAEHGERLERIEAVLLREGEDLRRRLAYALGELRRRDELAERLERRPWWRRIGGFSR